MASLQSCIDEHGSTLSDIEISSVLADLTQRKLSSRASMDANPYAPSLEVLMRGIGAILCLDHQPNLKDDYIGNKLDNGFTRLLDALQTHHPEIAEQLSSRFRRFAGQPALV